MNGNRVGRWEDLNKAIVYATTPAVEIAFVRDALPRIERIVPEKDEKLQLKRIGIYPVELVSVDVLEGTPAAAAGCGTAISSSRPMGPPSARGSS